MAGRDVHFVKQTPAFIKNFKSQMGYKEPDNFESKFKKLENSAKEDEEDREGELPAMVLGSNVTEEEANEFLAKTLEDDVPEEESETSNADTEETKEEGKIVFKKPKKRKSEDKSTDKDNKKKFKDKKPKTSSKAVKNSSLLSFGDDEEEEG